MIQNKERNENHQEYDPFTNDCHCYSILFCVFTDLYYRTIYKDNRTYTVTMAGGLLNIISIGNANVILTGNPTKTFFKATYSKYTNFGLQKFRLDYEGSRDLRLSTPSQYTFKIKRYADLLMDTYLVLNLPDIWSPIYNPTIDNYYEWAPYNFRWIKDIGTQIIRSIEINCGSTLLQKYTGDYLSAVVDRDFTTEKKDLFNRMTGNVPELNDPANAFGRSNTYPNAFYTNKFIPGTSTITPSEPSIRGRTLYIPINAWFTLDSRCAFPLVSLQYNELTITVTLRPIQEMFQVRDVLDQANGFPYIQPDFNKEAFRMYRFLQTPPDIRIDTAYQALNEVYENQTQIWNADVHLMATYCFLSTDESKLFAVGDQIYLIKDVFQYKFPNVTGTSRIKLENSMGMVSNWMWYLQRNDVNLRNEWNNYTNWPYVNLPSNIQFIPKDLPLPPLYNNSIDKFNSLYTSIKLPDGFTENKYYNMNMVLMEGPSNNPNEPYNTGFYMTGDLNTDNQKEIMLSMGILFEGEYRENIFPSGVYDYIEKYTRTNGSAKDGIYCYNYCLHTSPFDYQPSGAINLSKFKSIELELSTYVPPVGQYMISETVCDTNGGVLAVSNKQSWRLYDYNFDLTLYEERYNILSFIGGNCAMMYAR